MKNSLLCVAASVLLCSSPAMADGEGDNHPETVRRIPKLGIEVPADVDTALRSKLKRLQDEMTFLKKAKPDGWAGKLAPDVMIFERAVRIALDHQEFFHERDLNKADQLLDEGLRRMAQLKSGQADWTSTTGLVVRGYISRIDNTVQPYGLVIPETYDLGHRTPSRCDVWFHGRGETSGEVNFIFERMKKVGRYNPQDTIVLHPYGRYSNAFKFAGEVDVLEALQDTQQRYRIDENRISVRGFSMGGAGCWQFAVHYPNLWFAANPGAGFSETPQFLKSFQKETLNPTPWEQQLWNLYDCDKYALNLSQLPTIAYSGEVDVQKQAADVMEVALAEHDLRLKHVIGKGMGHTIDDASKLLIDESLEKLAIQGRDEVPDQLSFETYTLKYNNVAWLTIDGIKEHWKRSSVNATKLNGDGESVQYFVQTENVTALSLDFPAGTFERPFLNRATAGIGLKIIIRNDHHEQQDFAGNIYTDGSGGIRLHKKENGTWHIGRAESAAGTLLKRKNLQGPIDDAFMDRFVFVRPTGQAAHPAVQTWTTNELDRAIEHWRRHFRGDAIVVDDVDVTDQMIQSDTHLVLWGDRFSNSVIAKIADDLPIQWTRSRITVGQQSWSAEDHAPILIYPNPLNPERYVVLNSNFTYRDYAYLNNARQVPMLPDWAVVDLNTPPGNVWPGKVVAADFFDETWQLRK